MTAATFLNPWDIRPSTHWLTRWGYSSMKYQTGTTSRQLSCRQRSTNTFPEGVSPASLSMPEICRAAVTTTAFTIQTVFQEEDVVRRCRDLKPKVAQIFEKVIKGANSSYKLNEDREVVKVDKKKRKK